MGDGKRWRALLHYGTVCVIDIEPSWLFKLKYLIYTILAVTKKFVRSTVGAGNFGPAGKFWTKFLFFSTLYIFFFILDFIGSSLANGQKNTLF
jgi:hypothetical protein